MLGHESTRRSGPGPANTWIAWPPDYLLASSKSSSGEWEISCTESYLKVRYFFYNCAIGLLVSATGSRSDWGQTPCAPGAFRGRHYHHVHQFGDDLALDIGGGRDPVIPKVVSPRRPTKPRRSVGWSVPPRRAPCRCRGSGCADRLNRGAIGRRRWHRRRTAPPAGPPVRPDWCAVAPSRPAADSAQSRTKSHWPPGIRAPAS